MELSENVQLVTSGVRIGTPALATRGFGDEQFAVAEDWERAGRLALVGIGVEPGLSDVFARYAQDHLFSEIDEVGVRDGADLAVEGYAFAPTFSIWTTIEECLNPPVIWERDRGWYTTAPFRPSFRTVRPCRTISSPLQTNQVSTTRIGRSSCRSGGRFTGRSTVRRWPSC